MRRGGWGCGDGGAAARGGGTGRDGDGDGDGDGSASARGETRAGGGLKWMKCARCVVSIHACVYACEVKTRED